MHCDETGSWLGKLFIRTVAVNERRGPRIFATGRLWSFGDIRNGFVLVFGGGEDEGNITIG